MHGDVLVGGDDDGDLAGGSELSGARLLKTFPSSNLCLCPPPSHPLPLTKMVLFVMAAVGGGLVKGQNP